MRSPGSSNGFLINPTSRSPHIGSSALRAASNARFFLSKVTRHLTAWGAGCQDSRHAPDGLLPGLESVISPTSWQRHAPW